MEGVGFLATWFGRILFWEGWEEGGRLVGVLLVGRDACPSTGVAKY